MSGFPRWIAAFRGVVVGLVGFATVVALLVTALTVVLPSAADADADPTISTSTNTGTSDPNNPVNGVLQVVSGVGTVVGGLVGSSPSAATAPSAPTSAVPTSAPVITAPHTSVPTTAPSAPRNRPAHTSGSTAPRAGHHTSPTTTRPRHDARTQSDSNTQRHVGTSTPHRLRQAPHRAATVHTHRAHREPRLGVASPLVERRAATLASALGLPLVRPGQTVMLLMGAATGLAVLILALLVLVGRRPDPRLAASAQRLRSHATD